MKKCCSKKGSHEYSHDLLVTMITPTKPLRDMGTKRDIIYEKPWHILG